ncbi:aldehyde dehydrogenase family protein [Streptomyces sp. NPDC047042]|uniref:aldehyde dehydrogenase family protein n=1 Tax=Streptomyces sp. NPDC047042 TaxID=3154807 RepID=UPI0033E75FBA
MVGGLRGIVRRDPSGVVAGIVPWNMPLTIVIWKAIEALAVGNAVVLKADEKTPSSVLGLAEVGRSAGLCNVVFGDVTPSAPGCPHPKARKVSFTARGQPGARCWPTRPPSSSRSPSS